MASTEKIAETEEKEFKMELSSSETSCDSVLAKEVDVPGSTSLCAADEKRAARDAAFGPPVEERSSQTSTKQPCSKGACVNSSEESSCKGGAPTCFRFLKKLWAVTESIRFKSIWWGGNGKCIVINEDLFEEEVLARRGRLRIFENETMRSFTHHLYQHGFTTKLGIFPKSDSRSDLQAEERAREIHFYYNPNFRMRFLHELMKYQPKNQKPAGLSPNTDLHERRQKRKRRFEHTLETIPEDETAVFTPSPRKRPALAVAQARRASPWARTASCTAPCSVPCSAPCSSDGGEAHSSQHVPVAAARQPQRDTSRLSSCGGSSRCPLCGQATPVPRSFADKQSLQ